MNVYLEIWKDQHGEPFRISMANNVDNENFDLICNYVSGTVVSHMS